MAIYFYMLGLFFLKNQLVGSGKAGVIKEISCCHHMCAVLHVDALCIKKIAQFGGSVSFHEGRMLTGEIQLGTGENYLQSTFHLDQLDMPKCN